MVKLGRVLLAMVLAACAGDVPPAGGTDGAADARPGADGAAGSDGPPPRFDAPAGAVEPPLGGSSGGSGGAVPVACAAQTAGGVQYRLIAPSAAAGAPAPLLVVFSGTEGGAQMCQNLQSVGPSSGLGGALVAVLDGVAYRGDGAAGATALDAVRAAYDVDNDRTWLLSESAGTTAGLELGFHLRQSWFAAYWVNDLNAADTPGMTAAALGFAPWGNAGPGGDFADADAVVAAMRAAGYRVADPAPYDGAGAGQHGSPQQFLAAVAWFPGKRRP